MKISGQPSIALLWLFVWKYIPIGEFVWQKDMFGRTPNGDSEAKKGTQKGKNE